MGNDKKIIELNKADSFKDQFEKIYEDQFDRLYFFARSMVRSEALAEDIVAEVFLNLWKSRERFSEIRELDAYLFISVKNQATRMLYEEPQKMDVSYLEKTVKMVDRINPEEILLEKELTTALDEVVSRLPDQCQLIFRMARNKHMKYKEIAEELDITVSTVRTQLTKASSIIRKYLLEKYHESNDSDDQYQNASPFTYLIAFLIFAG